MAKPMTKKVSYISVPSQIISSLSPSAMQSLLQSPKKHRTRFCSLSFLKSTPVCLWLLFFFAAIGMLKLWRHLDVLPGPCVPCGVPDGRRAKSLAVSSDSGSYSGNREVEESDFWKQPDGLGLTPCLRFSGEYERTSMRVVGNRSKYLMVVVAGGLNQQMNQIVDAVIIARILGAALVVPILQVNVIWEDESEFSDIFDLDHFKEVLADDVRVVSSLPSSHVMTRPVERSNMPLFATPKWIRSNYLKRINREYVMLLRGLDSRLSKDLPPDLQRLRCKVAFHALRFAPRILEIGTRIADRMRSKGPYLALHLRMEKDVWVRTGCLPGLGDELDNEILDERESRPDLLTSRSNISLEQRKLAGLCPLNAIEVTRLLKALGAPRESRIYWAGGAPFGGDEALRPLKSSFPNLYNKEDLALPDELTEYGSKASSLAAIDHVVCVMSDVFMPSHGGNMAHTIQGTRAYTGHRKYITPNKRQMLPYFLNSSIPEEEFNSVIRELHRDSIGQPEIRAVKLGRDVTKYPAPDCMCTANNNATM